MLQLHLNKALRRKYQGGKKIQRENPEEDSRETAGSLVFHHEFPTGGYFLYFQKSTGGR